MSKSALSRNTATISQRITSIDALRGLVILLMLVDHTREFFFLHAQVSDPMNVDSTNPSLFFTRLAAHLCAPIFVALTGLAACIYGERKGSRQAASAFLFKRGLFLIALEWTVINFAWTFDISASFVYLQVIWVIGLSMLALSGLLYLPRTWLLVLAVVIVLGHNMLDPISFMPGESGYTLWTILHDRGTLDLPWGGQARTSYPLLPWIGTIALGYAIGPWFAAGVSAQTRGRRLLLTGAACLLLFILLRVGNVYGEPVPWEMKEDLLHTIMSFLNLTKYPPSADFLLLTLGCGCILLCVLERLPQIAIGWLLAFGAAPLFFYILHLYLLHGLNRISASLLAPGQSGLISVPSVAYVWLLAALVAVPCWSACRYFAQKKRNSSAWWMRYL
ncbi:hypothetical protein D3C72_67550 [compost metagenome]